MQVAILIRDGGDGSSCLDFFKNGEIAMAVAESDDLCELFGMNEGSPTFIEVMDNFNPPGGWCDEYYKDIGIDD